MKHKFGVIELFYGSPWDWQDRLNMAPFFKQAGFQFYIYAPKADGRLRKHWQHKLEPSEINSLKSLQQTITSNNIKFGVALSPSGLHENLDNTNLALLRDKVRALDDLGLNYLGLFFDDMRGSPDVAKKQIEIIENVRASTNATLIFAPTYYSSDELLDVFFGPRPDDYLDTIGHGVHPSVEILWTGPKVISHDIPSMHLQEIGRTLRRKPFLCDNLFANDGPMFCNFLRLQPVIGRHLEAFQQTSGWCLNPMNQAQLSRIILLSFINYAQNGHKIQDSFSDAVKLLCAPATADLILSNGQFFNEQGLSELSEDQKTNLRAALSRNPGPVEKEILDWLDGKYTVGFEVLTD